MILVDDGSTDDSGALCDKLASTHDNISCYHQENAGSGPARNAGIQKAQGDYIAFFDIDDRIETTFLARCRKEIERHCSPDVLMFSYDSFDDKYKSLTPIVFDSKVCSSNDEIREIYVDHLLGMEKTNGFVWNKVYKREFIVDKNLTFPRLLIQQDEVFNIHVYEKASTLVIIPDVLYHYVVYDKGNTRSNYIQERLSIYNSVKEELLNLYRKWELDDIRALKYIYRRFFNSILFTMNYNNTHKQAKITRSERLKKLKMLMECDETRDCIENLEKLNAVPEELLPKIYFNAIKHQRCFTYRLIRKVEQSTKVIKWSIKKHLL